jgi:hypothetical protein
MTITDPQVDQVGGGNRRVVSIKLHVDCPWDRVGIVHDRFDSANQLVDLIGVEAGEAGGGQ